MTTAIQQSMFLVPQGSLEGYIQTVNSIPVLTAAEERELAERLQQQGDLEAARQLVMSHLRFVVHIARSYAGYGLPQADLIQEGNIGLMEAGERFDPPGLLRGALDKVRNPRVCAAQLAHGQGGDHQGPTQAVLQPAQGEEASGLVQR